MYDYRRAFVNSSSFDRLFFTCVFTRDRLKNAWIEVCREGESAAARWSGSNGEMGAPFPYLLLWLQESSMNFPRHIVGEREMSTLVLNVAKGPV